MKSTTKKSLTVLLGVTVMATLASCGPSQQEQDQKAASDTAKKFVEASYKDKCLYDADYTTQAAIDKCVAERTASSLSEPSMDPFTVDAVEPWGAGYAVKLKGLNIEVVGVLKIGNSWKVSKEDTTSEAVASQSDWACQVIGGPDCGAGK